MKCVSLLQMKLLKDKVVRKSNIYHLRNLGGNTNLNNPCFATLNINGNNWNTSYIKCAVIAC